MFDLRLKGRWCETHERRCFVSLSKMLYPLLSTQPRKTGNCPDMTEKLLIGMLSNSTNLTIFQLHTLIWRLG